MSYATDHKRWVAVGDHESDNASREKPSGTTREMIGDILRTLATWPCELWMCGSDSWPRRQ